MTVQELAELSLEKAVLIDFWAEWCGPCKTFTPVLEKIVSKYSDLIHLEKIDVDKDQATAAQFRVQSIPTLVLLKDGKVAGVSQGAMSAPQLEQWLKKELPDLRENVDESDLDEVLKNLPPIPDEQRLEILNRVRSENPDNSEILLEYLRSLVFSSPKESQDAIEKFGQTEEGNWLSKHFQLLAEFLSTEAAEIQDQGGEPLSTFYRLVKEGKMEIAAEKITEYAAKGFTEEQQELKKLGVAFFASLGDSQPANQKYRKMFNMYLN
nr:thioredoxin [Saprospiraceae bacterium]